MSPFSVQLLLPAHKKLQVEEINEYIEGKQYVDLKQIRTFPLRNLS
jgi:hypothetical protein